jgi:hypothetical protein
MIDFSLQVKKKLASFRFQAGFLKNTITTGFVSGVVSAKKECFSKIKSAYVVLLWLVSLSTYCNILLLKI